MLTEPLLNPVVPSKHIRTSRRQKVNSNLSHIWGTKLGVGVSTKVDDNLAHLEHFKRSLVPSNITPTKGTSHGNSTATQNTLMSR